MLMSRNELAIIALSGGVDSAVSAILLRETGYSVQCLHMSNWEDDEYCEAAKDFQDTRRLCQQLDLPLHRVNFSDEYKELVFAHFLDEYQRGRTPNPDVLCNREIKFGVLREYVHRLGGHWLATGHYTRIKQIGGRFELHKGQDPNKDQSYFLHAIRETDLTNVLFPIGDRLKKEVREIARKASLTVANKKESSGICFIGERPFSKFLGQYLPTSPGEIKDPQGESLGTHLGLPYYTLGQRRGLGIGGLAAHPQDAWYVADKNLDTNELVVVQGTTHPLLYKNYLTANSMHWINKPPPGWSEGIALKCCAKTRYRQPDQACTAMMGSDGSVEVYFEQPQRAVTPGQYVVLYRGSQCLGGAIIDDAEMRAHPLEAAAS